MDNKYKLDIELLDEVRKMDFWNLKEMILKTSILNAALNKALMEKGIILKQEFDAALCDVKLQFSDLEDEIAKNKEDHEKRINEICEIIDQKNKEKEETMHLLKDVLGINI